MDPRIRVLVVDDSAFARTVLRRILAGDAEIDVIGAAHDGLDALEKIAELAPDVITLDLMMPELDGLGVLQALASRPAAPRAIVVTMTDMQTRMGVEALAAGAFDAVHKPTALATDRLYELGDELVRKVKEAGRSSRPRSQRRPSALPIAPPSSAIGLVVIGASAGGPQAVTRILRSLPADFRAPIAVALHMPPGYTAAFAARVAARECELRVREAVDGEELRAGDAVIGRGGMHLTIERSGATTRARLGVAPVASPYKPSVDVLFASAAAAWGQGALGVVLTGMGDDGLAGARALRAAGAPILVESEESCVVYGMPRVVSEAALATGEAPLERMAEALLGYVGRGG